MRRLPSKVERLGDDADGQDAGVTRGAGDDRCSPRAGAAAHAGGDEAHVGTGQVIDDLVDALFGRGTPDFRLRTGAETLRHIRAELDEALALDMVSAWASVLATTKSTPAQSGRDHVVDRVAAATADAEHADAGLELAVMSGFWSLIVIVLSLAFLPPSPRRPFRALPAIS